MNDESILVVCLLVGLAIMCVVLVMYQRRRERLLAGRDRIEIPIYSTLRTVFVVIAGIVIVPVLVAVTGAVTGPMLRRHALAATLLSIAGGGLALLVSLAATRSLRMTGVLTLTPTALTLVERGEMLTVDLQRTFELVEASTTGPGSIQMQVVQLTQDRLSWGFSYGLPLGRRPHGTSVVDRPLGPLLGGEARVIHDRVRAQPTATR